MDNKDKKILYELDKDSRSSYSQIAKATRISQETVRYRINNLILEGVIQKFLTILNTSKLGNSFYQIMLKLQNIDKSKKEKIISFLSKNNHVAWIGNLEGIFDMAFIIYVKNQIELQKFVNELTEKFSKYIMKKTLSINTSAEFFPRDYLINKKRNNLEKSSYEMYEEIASLDKINTKICTLLGENSRISSVEIAEKLNLSPDSILNRLRSLKKGRIILGYTLVLNQEKLNQAHYKILLNLNNLSKEKEIKLLEFLRKNNRIIALIKSLAEWDYEVDIEVENFSQLKDFTMDLTTQFSEVIRNYDILRILNMPKYTFFP